MLLIISLLLYWLGHVKEKIKDAVARWMPDNLDCIPLQVWTPVDLQVASYEEDSARELMND